MKKELAALFIAIGILVTAIIPAEACTNFLVTKGASVDGSVMITYAADSHSLYGELYHWPAATYKEGDMLKIYEWDTGRYLGEIPQALQTYNVVGNMNEFQLAIAETTYGGRGELLDTTGIIDYGSLIYLSLQRTKTAREAIKFMTDLVAEYGYCSAGESLSIADANEAWIMEIIGKGTGNKGAVWVARMIPDGYVSAHANQARITTFPFSTENKWSDPNQTTFHSPDVISFAREKGYYNGLDAEFSFSDIYAPLEFTASRFSEIRAWAFFKDVNKDMWQYFDYVKGNVIKNENGIATNRMPLWVQPDKKVSAHDLMEYMRDYLQGTELDMTKDVGAGPFGMPYRWRPLTWFVDSVEYVNERATVTQQTGFGFVSQSRSWLPDVIGGINWFCVDDIGNSVYTPIYSSTTKIPTAFAVGNGSMAEFSETSAFWLFNMVANLAYQRYDLISVDIKKARKEIDEKYIDEVQEMDKKVGEVYAKDPKKAASLLSDFSYNAGQWTFERWKKLFYFLTVKYIDGNVKTETDGVFATTETGVIKLTHPGYPEWFLRMIVDQTKDKLMIAGQKNQPKEPDSIVISKANINIMIGAIVVLAILLLIMMVRRRK